MCARQAGEKRGAGSAVDKPPADERVGEDGDDDDSANVSAASVPDGVRARSSTHWRMRLRDRVGGACVVAPAQADMDVGGTEADALRAAAPPPLGADLGRGSESPKRKRTLLGRQPRRVGCGSVLGLPVRVSLWMLF